MGDDEISFEADVERFAAAVFATTVAGFEALSIHLGDRLGLYTALRDASATADELAERAGIHRRYALEWLEQQAVAGYLTVDGDRFALPAAHAEVLANPHSLAYSAPMPRMLAAGAAMMSRLIDAYRTGDGVSWADLGPDARDAQGDVNRPLFEHALADALASVAPVHEVLSRPGARIADVACGHGWSAIALAHAYPDAFVEGFDVDEASIDAARHHAAGMPRVSFTVVDGEELAAREAQFDAAFVFEALHDMPDPVGVLSALHRAVKPDGVVVVMDEAVAHAFAPPGDELERIMYGYSLFICLPDSMSTPGSAATGTVMRPATLERYAREAGFRTVSILPIEGFGAFRFYLHER